jgi:hypothetical protein
MGHRVEKMFLDTMGGNLGGTAPGKFRPFLGPKAHGKPPNKEAGNPTENTLLSASSPSSRKLLPRTNDMNRMLDVFIPGA